MNSNAKFQYIMLLDEYFLVRSQQQYRTKIKITNQFVTQIYTDFKNSILFIYVM